ncbi:MAG: glycosyltransferase family 4 protein [Candidatus Nanohaloarchaea archaeon]|nr:glycosyltransferase family 4 protein [Candidatus Nanohaloarchaea archaeon]
MNVGIVARSVYPLHGHGGAEKHVFYVARGLAERGVDVHLFTLAANDATDEDYRELAHPHLHLHEVPYVDLGLGRANFIQFEKRLIARWPLLERMDLVHSHGVFPVATYSFVADTPIVVTTHGLEEYRLPHLKYPLAPFNLVDKVAARRTIDRFVALSQGNAADIMAYLGVEEDRITEIPNGVDTDVYRPTDTSELEEEYELEENVVVAVSRLVKYKGHHLLVDAVNAMENTSLVIAGNGPFRSDLEQRAGSDVHFAGFVDEAELPAYYSLGDVFALPTFGEGMPLSILEAFACGTPVLSTQVGAIPDVVDRDVGRVVPPQDRDALRQALEDLFSDSERLAAMGETARQRAVNQYSWETVAEQTFALYQALT